MTWRDFTTSWEGKPPHYVLCREDKTPATPTWRHLYPKEEAVHAHPGPVGIVPGSMNCVVIDIDEGGQQARQGVIEALGQPAVEMKSMGGGWHLWYWQTDLFSKKKIDLGWIRGDMICSGGYVVVTAPELLNQLLECEGRSLDARRLLSLDMAEFRSTASANGSEREIHRQDPFTQAATSARRDAAEAPALRWEFENCGLFEDPTFWSEHDDVAVAARLVNTNERMGHPLDAEKLLHLCERQCGELSPMALEVLAMAGGEAGLTLTSRAMETLDRDLEIASMREDGYTWDEIGVEFEIDPSTAYRAAQRVAA